MVYDVGADALPSLQMSTTVGVFSYTRHYQYLVVLRPGSPNLRSSSIRRALNIAIDRSSLVADALNGRGLPSTGPVWPKHWAAPPKEAGFSFRPREAADTVAAAGGLRFTCLVPPEEEILALVLKRQLADVGVEMILEERSIAEVNAALQSGNFESVLVPSISAPSILRTYLWWHSKATKSGAQYANRRVDSALDTVRHALTDDEYRQGVLDFQRAILDDPPAMFLAWTERARAVNRRFTVPATGSNIDILGSLRLWQPVASDALSTD
jgi:peptide/nickel transport system substrate-binding protein